MSPTFRALDLATLGLADGKGCMNAMQPEAKKETETMTKPAKADIYSRVTGKIVADLEKGVRPWAKPWSTEHAGARIVRPLRHNGKPYQGLNILLLWGSAVENGFSSPVWMTFKQARDLGAHVRQAEKGSLVVFADTLHKTETDDKTGEEIEKNIPFMKGYTVFNVDQIDGLPFHYYAKPEQPHIQQTERNECLECFFRNTGALIRHGGNRAFFSPAADFIQMPPFPAFRDAESYYATLAHEMTHWTGHASRLDRNLDRQDRQHYAREELVAELGAAFLCANLAITPETREDHAAYIAHWLKALKDDKRFIFSAASHASRAADHLEGYQTQEQPRIEAAA